MKGPTNAREAALLCLLEVEQSRFPDDALERLGGGLDRRDRSLCAAMVFGVLRWRSRLEWILTRFLSKPDKTLDKTVRITLLLGLFQILYLSRVPDSAAVNESVKVAKKHGPPYASKIVNAVLRAVVRSEKVPLPEDSDLPRIEKNAVVHAHPDWLVEKMIDQLGFDEAVRLMEANNLAPHLTLRVNTRRTGRQALTDLLTQEGFTVENTLYSPAGLRIIGQVGPVDRLPGFSEGYFVVQDEAAQLVGFLSRPKSGERALDACAGLGGKTLHMAESPEGRVFGLDPDRNRLVKAARQSHRLKSPGAHLVRGDLTHAPFSPSAFDLVLVDAPCSNLGVIRRRPDVKWSKSGQDPARLAEYQKELLSAAATLVKPGGRLVYAVCTWTREETTDVVDDFWMNHLEFGLFPAASFLPPTARALVSPDGMLRAWPHRHGTDGFFAAVLQRKPAKPEDRY